MSERASGKYFVPGPPRLALGDTSTHISRAGWWEPIAVNSGAMWVDKQSDRNATSRDPARGGVAQAPNALGMVGLGCLVIRCLLHQLRVCAVLSPPSLRKLSASLLQSNKHLLQDSVPRSTSHGFCCGLLQNPSVSRFRCPRSRIARCQDGGGWCPSPVLVRRGLSSALSSFPSLRSLPASRLADFGVVVKARTVDPLCLRCGAL